MVGKEKKNEAGGSCLEVGAFRGSKTCKFLKKTDEFPDTLNNL